jgi:hypothetical protein
MSDQLPSIQRMLGAIDARQDAQEAAIGHVQNTVSGLDGKVDRILLHLEHQKGQQIGQRRTFAAMAAIVGAVFGVAGEVAAQWFTNGGQGRH